MMGKGSGSPKEFEFGTDSIDTPGGTYSRPRKSRYNQSFAEKLAENLNYSRKKKDIKTKSASTKSILKKMLFGLHSCWVSFITKGSACLTASFIKGPKLFGDWVYKKTKVVGKTLGFAIGILFCCNFLNFIRRGIR